MGTGRVRGSIVSSRKVLSLHHHSFEFLQPLEVTWIQVIPGPSTPLIDGKRPRKGRTRSMGVVSKILTSNGSKRKGILASKGNRKGKCVSRFLTSPLPPLLWFNPHLKPRMITEAALPHSLVWALLKVGRVLLKQPWTAVPQEKLMILPRAQPTPKASVWGHQLAAPQSSTMAPSLSWPAVLSQPWAGCPVPTAPIKANRNSPNSFWVASLKRFEAWLLFLQL